MIKLLRLTALYVALFFLTIMLCVYVMVSYVRNKSYRKPPAGLMLSKTACDLIFSFTFFLMLIFVDIHDECIDNTDTKPCQIYGPIFVISFIASQNYFTAICWDLYRTLSNPFRKPAADSLKLHIFLWLFSCMLIGSVSRFNVFRYRESYGICFSCNTGEHFSYYNLILFYIPMLITNGSGVIVTIYAFKRLSNGLEKTFELRQQIIKGQLILVTCLLSIAIITIITMGTVIYGKSEIECDKKATFLCLDPNPDCDQTNYPQKPRILLSILIFLNCGFDALAWFLLHKLTKQKPPKVSKTIHVTLKEDNRSSLISEHHTENDDNSNNSSGHQEDDYSNSSSNTTHAKKPQNVSNALRGEIISYMTAGIEKSIHYTAKETYDGIYAFADHYDPDIDITFNEDEEEHKLNKNHIPNLSHSKLKSRQDILNYEEPEPRRAQYPINIHHDPKTHQGVINEMYIQLPTQNVYSIKVPVFSNPSSSAAAGLIVNNNNNALVSVVNLNQYNQFEEREEQKEEEEEQLLASLDVKVKKHQKDDSLLTDDGNINGVSLPSLPTDLSLYESRSSAVSDAEVEMSEHKTEKTKLLQPQEQEAPIYYRQGSTGSTAGAIIESITTTISKIKNNDTIINSTETFNGFTIHEADTDEYCCRNYDGLLLEEKECDKYNGIPFKDYAPHVFRYLRQEIYCISDEEYLQSVRPPNFEEQKLIQEKFSEGRSGAFFFFTHDSKYIIKTVSKSEATLLLKILPEFVQHYSTNVHTLINRFFGLHSITMYNLCLYFVVLENVFVAGSKPHEIYDIKGSWIDRHTHHHVESGKLMKDLDLHKTLKLQAITADTMFKQIKADSKFLSQQNIMDYSVLLGIYYVGVDPSDVYHDRIMQHHNNNSYTAPKMEPAKAAAELQIDSFILNEMDGGQDVEAEEIGIRAPSYRSGVKKYGSKDKAVKARVIEGPGIYYLGIIDVLQEWNTGKKLERMAKVYLRCKSKRGISCAEPVFYRQRFLKKMHRIGIRPLLNQQ